MTRGDPRPEAIEAPPVQAIQPVAKPKPKASRKKARDENQERTEQGRTTTSCPTGAGEVGCVPGALRFRKPLLFARTRAAPFCEQDEYLSAAAVVPQFVRTNYPVNFLAWRHPNLSSDSLVKLFQIFNNAR